MLGYSIGAGMMSQDENEPRYLRYADRLFMSIRRGLLVSSSRSHGQFHRRQVITQSLLTLELTFASFSAEPVESCQPAQLSDMD